MIIKKNVVRPIEEREREESKKGIPVRKTREELHHSFGGNISLYDFFMHPTYSSVNGGSSIAKKIVADIAFDVSCSKADKRKHDNGNWLRNK